MPEQSDPAAEPAGGVGAAESAGGVGAGGVGAGGARPAVDPLKGFRGIMAATLVLETLTVLLALLVVTKIGDNGGPLGVGLVLALAAAMVVVTRFVGRPWAPRAVIALQVVTIACGLLVGALGAIGVIFGLVWAALLVMRRDVAGKLARGELPSQRPPHPG